MNQYFSKVLKVGERQREFNFRQLSHAPDQGFFVDVPDDRGQRVSFSMYKNADGYWKTAAQSLPLWIHNAEDVLNEAIEEFNAGNDTGRKVRR